MLSRLRRLSPTTWVTLQTVFEQAFWLLLFAIQAPLLGPRPFGLVSIVMVFVGFCEYVVTYAATEVLISLRKIEPLHFHTMMAACVAISLLLGIAIFLGAHEIAAFFGDPQLFLVVRWMAFLPLVSALSAAPTAAIKREMRFHATAARAIASLGIAGTTSLTLTLCGFGVWALVTQAILQRLVAVVVLWRASPIPFGLAVSLRHLREMYDYAAKLVLSCVMNWTSGQLPRFILGSFLGLTELGLFGMASRLNDILMQIVIEPKNTVARISLRQWADDPEGLRRASRELFLQMSVFAFPTAVGGAAVIPTLFHAWLDPRWYDAILPSQFLLLMAMPFVTFYCSTAILLAMNQQAAEAVISTVQTLTTALVVLAAAPFGLTVAAAVIALRPLLLLPMPLYYMWKRVDIPVSLVLGAQSRPLLAALVMGLCIRLLDAELEPMLRSIVALPILFVAGVTVYAALIALLMPDFFTDFSRRLLARLRPKQMT